MTFPAVTFVPGLVVSNQIAANVYNYSDLAMEYMYNNEKFEITDE